MRKYAKTINDLFYEISQLSYECFENLFINITNYYDEHKNPNIEDHLENSFILTKIKMLIIIIKMIKK